MASDKKERVSIDMPKSRAVQRQTETYTKATVDSYLRIRDETELMVKQKWNDF